MQGISDIGNPIGSRIQSSQSLSQKQSPKSKGSLKMSMQNPVLANPGAGQGSRSRERAILDKKQQSMNNASAQYHRDMELERIRQENAKER